jgi:hypothetical protein
MGSAHALECATLKVATEMALNVLAYNMKRVLAIIGRGWTAGGLGCLSRGLAHSNESQQTPQGALRAARRMDSRKTGFSARMPVVFCAPMPIRGLSHSLGHKQP